ncbi:GTP cyclohydrolase-2 [Azospirillaceae bacterium]
MSNTPSSAQFLSPQEDSLGDDAAAQAEGRSVLRAVERAIAALRRAEIVIIEDDAGPATAALAVETATSSHLDELSTLTGVALSLAITRQRAKILGLKPPHSFYDTPTSPYEEMVLTPRTELTLSALAGIVIPTEESPTDAAVSSESWTIASASPSVGAAVRLAKLARLLPATVVAPAPPEASRSSGGLVGWAVRHNVLTVRASEIDYYHIHAARTLQPVVEARVPLIHAENARLIAFRPIDGGIEHLAIVIGTPDVSKPVLIRLHSECFTGDALGSLRCDCGDQLRGAIAGIAREGSGILLYLAQEGRGIGLMNKLRAYRLQDAGADTIDANEHLGFEADERLYLPAIEMLRRLGVSRVRLMTNNPEKMRQLTDCGVEVVERVPHIFPSNGHNETYLRVKAERGGHLF